MSSVRTQHKTTANHQNFHKTQVAKVHNTKVYKSFAGLHKFLSQTKIKYRSDGMICLKGPQFLDLERNSDLEIKTKF